MLTIHVLFPSLNTHFSSELISSKYFRPFAYMEHMFWSLLRLRHSWKPQLNGSFQLFWVSFITLFSSLPVTSSLPYSCSLSHSSLSFSFALVSFALFFSIFFSLSLTISMPLFHSFFLSLSFFLPCTCYLPLWPPKSLSPSRFRSIFSSSLPSLTPIFWFRLPFEWLNQSPSLVPVSMIIHSCLVAIRLDSVHHYSFVLLLPLWSTC